MLVKPKKLVWVLLKFRKDYLDRYNPNNVVHYILVTKMLCFDIAIQNAIILTKISFRAGYS